MTSYREQSHELTSSTQLFSTGTSLPLNTTVSPGNDTAASICAHLVVHHGLSHVRIAHALGLPSLVVEESIRNGVSSSMLRTQLRNWLCEVSGSSPAQKLRVPEALFTQLQEDCAADEIEHQENERKGVVSPYGDDWSPFAALDPVSQQHFTQLQHSVGQSFISILNDPGESTTNVDWTTWLGGKLYAAFDFNGHVGELDDMLRSYLALQTGPESSAALLAEYPPSQDFSGYVNLTSKAYQANRREGIANDAREWREDGTTNLQGDYEHRGGAATTDRSPWPTSVPTQFFAVSYDTASELDMLSNAVGESLPAATSTSPPAAAATPTQIVDGGTFAADYEYLESRNKELRAWESAVEKCLLQHVKYRSEDFFVTSRQFSSLSSDARTVLANVRVAREGGMRAGEHFIAEYFRIGNLYRRRQNFLQLNAIATTAQQVLRRLGDVENWAALPERDFGEVLTISSALVDLETVLRGTKDAEQGITWKSLSQLKCLAEVPGRVRKARKTLEKVVLEEYCGVLVSNLNESEASERLTAVCESVTRLGVLNGANHLYQVRIVELLLVMAQETLVSLFMNTGTLDDAKANELLTIAGNRVALAVPASREQLCGFAKYLRFQGYKQVLQQFVDVLVDFVTRVSQNWGFFLTGELRVALAMYENRHILIETATRELLGRVCGEAESLIASLLGVYTNGSQLASTAELVQLVRSSVQFPMRMTSDVADRLVSLLHEGGNECGTPTGFLVSSTASGPNSPSSAADWEPTGFVVYRPTKVIGTTVQRIVKRFFRYQHSVHRENVTMVTEGETWVAKEAVDESIQQQVEDMCTMDATALQTFRLRSLRALFTSGDSDGGCSQQRHSGSLPRAADTGGTDDLLSTGATKLYVRVRCNTGAAVVANSKAPCVPTEVAPVAETDELEGRLVPSSLLVLMDLLHKYHEYIALFPFLAFDVASRMSELLDEYEGQTTAMVLGARAVEKGILPTITTQHLCVASQCVAFLIDFIPALLAHLTAAMQGDLLDASLRGHAPRDVLAVANALGLVGGVSTAPTPSDSSSANTTPDRAKMFVKNDWNRVVRNCRAHRNEFFSKVGSLVYRKVNGLGQASMQRGCWSASGNEWVMSMLREVARLMRVLRPLLPPGDMDGVMVPLLGSLSVMLRESTVQIPSSAEDDRAAAASDVMLFTANVEKFGYDVLKCAAVTSVSIVMQGGESFVPVSSEEAVLRWFLPPSHTSSSQLAAETK
ncbi:Vps54-like protein, putative [Leishmania lindenbergi]|uniref:Vps54-like protein n=1 Tax=Leishmania lindenbergi TaxID=651832 RepID=A0AAW2ZS17_9TRYP